MFAECCEIAWKQGLDLYSYADNRLLKGFEYVAKFNLGNEVPFTEWLDRTGKYHHKTIARQDRGPLRAVYEQVYNHYVNRMGLTTPFTKQASEKVRPEGPGKPGADHPGYGTLYFTRPKSNVTVSGVPAAPGGMAATGDLKGNIVTWVASIGASKYNIKRSTKSGGNYEVIAKNIKETNYTDTKVKAGVVYHYTVSACNANGESKNAFEIEIAAGLPSSWKQQDIGNMSLKGSTSFDGNVFTIEGIGMGADSIADEAHFTYQPLRGDGEIVARFVPQPSSQFSMMGLSIREDALANSAHVSLIIYPGKTGQIEAPNWHARLLARSVAGEKAVLNNVGPALSEPAVTWGRLTGYVWLRLRRKGNNFTGATSYDGETWQDIGTATVALRNSALIGLSVSSGMRNSTTIMFDNVKVSASK
jgi:hypothetical protein